MLLIRRNFSSPENCEELVRAFQQAVNQTMPISFDIRRMTNRTEIYCRYFNRIGARQASDFLSMVRHQALNTTVEFFEIEKTCYVEFTLLTEMQPGDYHTLHADNQKQESNGEWVPNHTPQRDYTAILYLNNYETDFRGGLLRFTSLGEEVAPERGLLIGFPCDHRYQHEVTMVQEGYRYALSIWMTLQPERAEFWEMKSYLDSTIVLK